MSEIGFTFLPSTNKTIIEATAIIAGEMDQPGLIFGVFDDYPHPRPYDQLIAIAQQTRLAKLATVGVAIPREDLHLTGPINFIKQINDIRPHSLIFGMVPGAWMEQLGKKPATVGEMENALNTIKTNLGEESKDIRFLLGAWGPKMAALAGRVFDQVKIGGTANPLMIEEMRKRLQIGANEISRSELPLISVGATTVVDKNRERARSDAKRRAAMYIAVIGKNDPFAMEIFSKEIQQITNAVEENDYNKAVKCLPDELANMFIIAGSPDDINEHAMSLYNAGAYRVEFGSPHGIGQDFEAEFRGLNIMKKEVVPVLLKELGRKLS